MPSTGTYKINGLEMPQPTEGHWLPRRAIDIQGDNRPIYSPVRAFQLSWDIRTYEEWEVLVVAFNQLQASGTAVVEIPAYPSMTGTAFGYREYSGTTLSEPVIGGMFHEQFPTDVSLVIGNIRTQ